jgi:hypothetical protein
MARPADRQGSEASRPGQGSGGKEPETVTGGAIKGAGATRGAPGETSTTRRTGNRAMPRGACARFN